MPVKIEEGKSFHARDYFFVGDPEKTGTWKLKKGGSPGVVDRVHVSAAASAIGPRPAHGKGARIPSAALAGVKSRIKAAMRKLDYEEEEMRESFGWLFGESLKFEVRSLKGKNKIRDEGNGTDGAYDEYGETVDVEVFKTGDYGSRGKYGESDLEQIAGDYNAQLHEAPVTIDHKKVGPAYGWVSGVRRQGNKLVASLMDMSKELVDAIKAKHYGKVSVEIYRKLKETGRPYLRAVSFLGAQVPEVKGLKTVELGEDEDEGEFVEMDFGERPSIAPLPGGASEGDPRKITRIGGEEEMEKVETLEKEKKELEARFAEAEGKLKEAEKGKEAAESELKKKTEKFAEQERERKVLDAEHAAKEFCDKQIAGGFVTPAQVSAGLADLLVFADLVDDKATIKFGEEEKKPGDILRDVFSQTQILEFKEIAKPEPEEKTDIAKFGELAKTAGVSVQEYREAAKEVAKYPDDKKMTPEKWIEAQKLYGGHEEA